MVFGLSAQLGAGVVGTPALDLLNKSCHLCDDWPCVQACDETALSLPDVDQDNEIAPIEAAEPTAREPVDKLIPPKPAQLTIDTTTCLPYQGPECGAGDNSCPEPGALSWDEVITDALCVGCGLCREACIMGLAALAIRQF